MILYINCCPREESRTDKIARALLGKLGEYEEVNLYSEKLQALNLDRLNKRTELIEKKDYSASIFDYAKQFASADTIVIAAPFWDLSFPAMLKTYIENIYVTGIVSTYDEKGMPKGLCKAQKLYYVTTAGGPYDGRYSYDYLKTLATDYLGIKETELIKAEMLDVFVDRVDEIVAETINSL